MKESAERKNQMTEEQRQVFNALLDSFANETAQSAGARSMRTAARHDKETDKIREQIFEFVENLSSKTRKDK